jgi:RNA polymerase sigma factor (sigma-70 family)
MQTDAELLRRAKRDPEAICVLFDRHADRLVAGLRGGGASHELALDVVQETFARLLEDGSRVRTDDTGSAFPWLRRVAINLAIDNRRRGAVDASARRRLGIALSPLAADESEQAIDRLDAASLSPSLGEALGELPAVQRAALLAHVVEQQSYAAIAAAARTSEQTIRARVSRGLRALQGRLSGG